MDKILVNVNTYMYMYNGYKHVYMYVCKINARLTAQL